MSHNLPRFYIYGETAKFETERDLEDFFLR